MNVVLDAVDGSKRFGSLPPLVVTQLRERFRERFNETLDVCNDHCSKLTWLPPEPPASVVFCNDRDEVCSVLRTCYESEVPVIAYGSGTSLEGQTNAPLGGICLDLSGMNKVLSVHSSDGYAVVQPGVSHTALNKYIEQFGVFFPVDPGSSASLGGMAATRASGTNSVRYGTMRENTLALEVVTSEGRVFNTGSLAKKSASRYHLTRLIVGSEGTLGVITELTVRLFPLPEVIAGGRCTFMSIEHAVSCVATALREQIDFARIELLDELAIRACNGYSALDLDESPTLFFEFHGTENHISQEARRWSAIVANEGGRDYRWSSASIERTRLWAARHDAWWAIHQMFPGRHGVTTDVCVPVSQLAFCVTQAKERIALHDLRGVIIGHVGDGNFHALIMLDEENQVECARAQEFISELNLLAIKLGGTCSGEHGIGQGKMAYMDIEHGSEAISVMRSIKRALDPRSILNPHKLF